MCVAPRGFREREHGFTTPPMVVVLLLPSLLSRSHVSERSESEEVTMMKWYHPPQSQWHKRKFQNGQCFIQIQEIPPAWRRIRRDASLSKFCGIAKKSAAQLQLWWPSPPQYTHALRFKAWHETSHSCLSQRLGWEPKYVSTFSTVPLYILSVRTSLEWKWQVVLEKGTALHF